MTADQTGGLAGVRRHDYLPFGEELFAGTDGRTAQQGYQADGVIQKCTSAERDDETGLDFMQARYCTSTQDTVPAVKHFVRAAARTVGPTSTPCKRYGSACASPPR
jgi:hypothetical protein